MGSRNAVVTSTGINKIESMWDSKRYKFAKATSVAGLSLLCACLIEEYVKTWREASRLFEIWKQTEERK